MKKVENLNLKNKSQKKGIMKETYQHQKTNHQSKNKLQNGINHDNKSTYQTKYPTVGGISKINLQEQSFQDCRWIPKS